MDINYYKKYEPIFNAWYIKEPLGDGSFGKVFAVERQDYGTYRAALKAITIPQSKSEIESVMADGMDEESVTAYFKQVVEDIVSEIVLMSKLKGNSTIVSYEDHVVMEHEEGIGWDILIRMELLNPLLGQTINEQFTAKKVAELGIDMCRALELCQRYNIIHRDIKPENIFVSETGSYKLGDFGIARTIERTTSGLSKKGTFTYMAPEVYKGEQYGSSVDIYSLGLVMYRLLNNNRAPFLPAFPAPITHNDREESIIKRIGGTPIPVPINGDERLSRIVLKACAYRSQDRYGSPGKMRAELEKYLAGEVGDRDDTYSMLSESGKFVCIKCNREISNTNNMFCENCGTPVSASLSGRASTSAGETSPVGSDGPGVTGNEDSHSQTVAVRRAPQQQYDSSPYTPPSYSSSPQSYSPSPYSSSPHSQYGGRQQSQKKSTGVIVAVVAACIVLLGIGLYAWIGPGSNNGNGGSTGGGSGTSDQGSTGTSGTGGSATEEDDENSAIPDVVNTAQSAAVQSLENHGYNVIVDESHNDTIPPGNVISQSPAAGSSGAGGSTVRITVSLGPEIREVTLIHRGQPVSHMSVGLNEEESVSVSLDPSGSVAEIEWINNEPGIFRVIPDNSGMSARIIGEAPGSGVLTIRAGTKTYMCTIIISTFEPIPGTRIRYMYDNMERRNTGVYLGIVWTSGRHVGDTTELVRDPGSDVWFMYGVNDNNREVFPTFDYDGTNYLMKYERAGMTTYFFNENGTGFFWDTNGENLQNFTWEFWTY